MVGASFPATCYSKKKSFDTVHHLMVSRHYIFHQFKHHRKNGVMINMEVILESQLLLRKTRILMRFVSLRRPPDSLKFGFLCPNRGEKRQISIQNSISIYIWNIGLMVGNQNVENQSVSILYLRHRSVKVPFFLLMSSGIGLSVLP